MTLVKPPVTEPEHSTITLDPLDEAFGPDGVPRGSYARLLEAVGVDGLVAERERIARRVEDAGVRFGGDDPPVFAVDPVPRIIEHDEWELVELGLRQRVRALNEFLADVYGARRIVAEGVLDPELLERAAWYDPAMAGEGIPAVRAHVAGPDLVRGSDGELRVLEDNVRAPSGLAYALAARDAMAPLVEASGLAPRPLEPALGALGRMLRNAAPGSPGDPRVVLLNDGPSASAVYEHRALADLIGMEIATAGELRRRGDRVLLDDAPVDVIYRRVDDERLTADDGSHTPLGELLVEALAAGTVACVNSPGTGVADDKAIHTLVERMIGFYLGEPVILRSVPGRWLGEPGAAEEALGRLGEIVVKPRWDFGGSGVTIGPRASAEELASSAASIRRDPGGFVAQEAVALSVHPTVADGTLASRHVDLRPFVITDEDTVTVVPGGLSRFARAAGEMVVNSGQGGGTKDTWVLAS